MNDITLSFHQLTSGYESSRRTALSRTVALGQHLAIMGPSGCGKTSLMKVISGLMPAKSGSIVYQGKQVSLTTLAWWRSQINYLPQSPVMGGETLNEVLQLPWLMKAIKTPRPTEQACLSVLAALGLAHPLSDPVSSLSGGERQRLAIARAALLPRPIWLLDEPTSALDHESRDRISAFLAQKHIVRISVSHDPQWYGSADLRFDMGDHNE